MTLAVAFVRKLPTSTEREELVFASDTRISFGQRLDHGPKIFGLPRSDALFAFAGDAMYAYPLALHLSTSISMYPRSVDRRFPLKRVRGHMLNVFEQIYRGIHTFPVGETQPVPAEPPVQFLFGGYAWHDDAFRIWYIDLDESNASFRFRRAKRRFVFIGDADAVKAARSRTMRLLSDRGKDVASLDLEPLEVLRDVIRSGEFKWIGGALQIAKVYRSMNTQFFSVLWNSTAGRIPHVFGRPLLHNETSAWPIFDPDALRFLGPMAEGCKPELSGGQKS